METLLNVERLVTLPVVAKTTTADGLRQAIEPLHASAFAWAVRCCGGDRDAAEDVLQATYVKLLDGRARFAGRSSFKTWFFGVVRRTACEHRRSAALRRLRDRLLGNVPPVVPPTPETEQAEREKVARLRGALASLSSRQSQVLHLVFYEEMTIQEAADVLGISVGSAGTHYRRGKRQLRKKLELDDPSRQRTW